MGQFTVIVMVWRAWMPRASNAWTVSVSVPADASAGTNRFEPEIVAPPVAVRRLKVAACVAASGIEAATPWVTVWLALEVIAGAPKAAMKAVAEFVNWLLER
jgi:hypothetical protein